MTNGTFRQFQELFAVPLRNGLTRPKSVRGHGVKMVNMGEIFAHRRIGAVPMDRVPLSPQEATNYVLKPGDLLFARQSLVLAGAGKCSIFMGDQSPVTFESHLIRARLNPRVADPLFYFYFFNSRAGQEATQSIVEQVAAAGIRGSDLARLLVPVPPLPVQRAIAHILGTLDDKIELNRRMNETLEAIARAIFKSWFVDFDPVRAKAEGCDPPGTDAETAGLFPDAFEDSALGKIPTGWRVEHIGDVVRCVGGSTPSTKESGFWDGDIKFATPRDLASLSAPVLLTTERTITERGLQRISSGLLPSGTVLLSSRAPIGYLAVAEVPVAVNQGFIAMVCDRKLPNHYVLQWARQNMDTIIANANGTTFLEISKKNFRPINVIVPSAKLLDRFSALAEPVHRRIVANLRESVTSAIIRDALLPRLVSGAMRLPGADCGQTPTAVESSRGASAHSST